mmetsp:Transcript_22711/g.28992  ORF Transcript_22711/g.28992 Transcript_22711/m.28992 type:complete len:88 (+) Transcript_22711:174-437(+)
MFHVQNWSKHSFDIVMMEEKMQTKLLNSKRLLSLFKSYKNYTMSIDQEKNSAASWVVDVENSYGEVYISMPFLAWICLQMPIVTMKR